jgi:hypothetical protein
MNTIRKKARPASMSFPIHSIRNVSAPEDLAAARTVYVGHAPLSSILELPTDENVRGYLVEAEGKRKRSPTQVHVAIRETLAERPSYFSVLNGGITVVAKNCVVNADQRTVTLTEPSIINGSQTQGTVRDFRDNGNDIDGIHIKFELIITSDDDLIGDISIARNFQNDVASLSIAGRKGVLDNLEISFQKHFPNQRLQRSESERPNAENEIVQTEKVLQVLAALLPKELWWKSGEPNKTYTYSAKATCLKDFRAIFEGSQDANSQYAKVYQYYLDMVGPGWKIYLDWKQHQGFQGSGLRSIERNGREITDVPDGIIFPILSALSEFVEITSGTWTFIEPRGFQHEDLIEAAKIAYMRIANSKPELMGKNRACYAQTEQITALTKRLLSQKRR